MERTLKVYNHLSRRLDRFFETGWRRAFGWLGFAVGYFAYIHAPAHGIVVDYGNVNIFLTFSTAAFVARGGEKLAQAHLNGVPGGGLVNPLALEPSAP